MVRVKVQCGAEEFIYETKVTESMDVITRSVSEMHNRRLQVRRLAAALRELAKFGPMRPEDQRGLTEAEINASGTSLSKDMNGDPLGLREGKHAAPPAEVQATMNRCADEADVICSNRLAKESRPTEAKSMEEAFMNLKGAVMIAYPMGLPEWDTVRQIIDGKEELAGTQDSLNVMEPDTSTLWFAGKQMFREQPLSKFIGTNEKTTIIAKLQKKTSGAPARQPPVDDETRKQMMSYWHKKQEEAKELENDEDDAYLNSAWANPKSLKSSVLGLDRVRFRPGQR